MLGFHPISAAPLSSLAIAAPVNSTPFGELRDNPEIPRVYLIEIDAPIPGGGTAQIRLSTNGYVSRNSQAAGGGSALSSSSVLSSSGYLSSGYGFTTYNDDAVMYPPAIKTALNFSSELFDSKTLTGRSSNGAGNIELLNGDGELDDILSVAWDNAPISIKVGADYFDPGDFVEVFRGVVESATWDTSRITLRVRDRQALFDEALQSNRYGGTGGLDGGADLAGKPIPLLYGTKPNIKPVLVDASNLIYQIHDGSVEAIDAVYFAGLLAAAGTDYTVDLANGRFTLLTAPNGIVTCDARGDNTGGYIDATTDIVYRLVTTHAGFTLTDFDLGSFELTKALNSAAIGYYIGEEETTLNTVLDDLMTGMGGFWGFDRYDRLNVGLVRVPGSPDITYTQDHIKSIRRISTPLPVWRTTTAYQRLGVTMTASEVAGAVSEARKAYLEQPVRLTELEDAPIKALHPLARILDVRSFYDLQADSANETSRLQMLHGTERDFYEIEMRNMTFRERLGMRVAVVYPRFGLDSGRNFIITGFNENHERDTLTLTVWG